MTAFRDPAVPAGASRPLAEFAGPHGGAVGAALAQEDLGGVRGGEALENFLVGLALARHGRGLELLGPGGGDDGGIDVEAQGGNGGRDRRPGGAGFLGGVLVDDHAGVAHGPQLHVLRPVAPVEIESQLAQQGFQAGGVRGPDFGEVEAGGLGHLRERGELHRVPAAACRGAALPAPFPAAGCASSHLALCSSSQISDRIASTAVRSTSDWRNTSLKTSRDTGPV